MSEKNYQNLTPMVPQASYSPSREVMEEYPDFPKPRPPFDQKAFDTDVLWGALQADMQQKAEEKEPYVPKDFIDLQLGQANINGFTFQLKKLDIKIIKDLLTKAAIANLKKANASGKKT